MMKKKKTKKKKQKKKKANSSSGRETVKLGLRHAVADADNDDVGDYGVDGEKLQFMVMDSRNPGLLDSQTPRLPDSRTARFLDSGEVKCCVDEGLLIFLR